MNHNTVETTPSPLHNTPSLDDRGVGGKLKRPTRSRPPSTPYSRPQSKTEPGRGRWILSKVVGGATKIVSSFFSRPPSIDQYTEDQEEEFNDELETNEESALNFEEDGIAAEVAAADPSRVIYGSSSSGQKQLESDHGVSEIEQLVKGKTFSRGEIDRLMEIIRSRAANAVDAELEKEDLSPSAVKDAKPKVSFEIPTKSLEEKQEDTNRVMWGTSTPILQSTPKAVFENARRPSEETHEDFNKTIWGASTPILQSASKVAFDSPGKHFEDQSDLNKDNWGISTPIHQSAMRDKVGASPIEIAKAYMGSRRSEMSIGPNYIVLKDEKVSQHGDESVSKQFFPSSSSKPSTCWPGAMIQDRRDYTTPLSQRSRFGLQNFSRTPYSRSVYTKKSTPKLTPLQGDSNVGLNDSFTPLQSRTPTFGQSRSNIVDDTHGSVGPIRSPRHKASAGTSRGPVYSHSSLKRPSQKPDTHTATIHPHSSQMARTILEHLERNPPTPKDKSAELKLAISWKNPPSSDLNTLTSNEDNNTFPFLAGKKMDQSVQKISSFPPLKNVFDGNGSVNETKLAGDTTAAIHGDNALLFPDFSANKDSTNVTVNSMDPELSRAPKASTRTSGNKPFLPSITIGKPDQKWSFPPINNSGFTFPVSTSSTLFSEPPTPSIMPITANCSSPPQPSKEGSPNPIFSFGSRNSTPPLVFSFPSTSNAPLRDETEIKFSFGSDKSRRMSFASIGKDAIYY